MARASIFTRWSCSSIALHRCTSSQPGTSGFSETTIGGVRHLGGDFEFTEVLRTGVRFGSRLQYEIGIAGQHFSNAGLFPPNEGVTYVSLAGAWYFR
jgi:hypothetical protein